MSTACVQSSPALRPTLGEKFWDDICVRSRTQTLPVSLPSEAALSLSHVGRLLQNVRLELKALHSISSPLDGLSKMAIFAQMQWRQT